MTTAAPTLMTGEEFVRLDGHEKMSLVAGVPVVEETERSVQHGLACSTVGSALSDFVKATCLGTVCGNNTSIRLKRNPDTVYGPDLCFFQAGRLTREQRASPVCDTIPELVVEVLMGSDDWRFWLVKGADYLFAGVNALLVVDLEEESAVAVMRDGTRQLFHNGDDITLPDVLPGFTLPLKRLFE